ncbi:MAG: hypothetical protein IJ409_02960 [Lachnospiraceae bacterium]|nr:hypothetical protein [Lachnospiraceae bacterium]
MKKTRLGKITFVLTCVCLTLFIVVKILDVWGLGRALDGFENMTKVIATALGQGELKSVLILFGKTFVIPIIWTLVGFLYAFAIKKCKPIKQSVCVVSALAVLAELILLMAGSNRYFWQLATRICFIIVFVLLFLELKKSGLRRGIYIAFGLTYMLTLVYVIVYMINVMRVLETDTAFYAILAYILLPVVFLSVVILVLGYILFPEKYIEV